VLYKCGWSPFEGRKLGARIIATLVNGELAYENGQVNDAVRGRRLAFGPTR
jgi:dihydroorotase